MGTGSTDYTLNVEMKRWSCLLELDKSVLQEDVSAFYKGIVNAGHFMI